MNNNETVFRECVQDSVGRIKPHSLWQILWRNWRATERSYHGEYVANITCWNGVLSMGQRMAKRVMEKKEGLG